MSNAVLELADRARFSEDITRALDASPDKNWVLASIDVKSFRLYNIWYGKEHGDAILAAIADTLLELRDTKSYPAGYLGDDDFFICMPNDHEIICEVYDKLQTCVDKSHSGGRFAVVMGLCNVRDHLGKDPFTLYNYARIVAANSRQKPGRNIHFFTKSDLHSLEEAHGFINETSRAFENEEFVVYLQTQQNSMSKQIVGFEALARWNHPEQGILKPEAFLPTLTQNKLVPRLDVYMWERVCKILARWKAQGRKLVPIAVNMTLEDIEELEVVSILSSLVEQYKIEPALLNIEITETILASSRDKVGNVVDELRAAGFRVYMDDFGSGYSSLGMLKDVQVDVVKLDMSLIDFTRDNFKRGMNVLSSVTSLAHRLELPLIVEGVQSQGQIFILQSLNCLYVQGFYFEKPLPVEQAEKLLNENAHDYWDLELDWAQRSTRELGAIDLDTSSALTLRSFKIFADHLLLNALLNLETGLIHIAQCSQEFSVPKLGESVSFEHFCERLFETQIIHPGDVERMKFYLDLDRLKARFYKSDKSISFRFRVRYEDEYRWVTIEIIPGANIGPEDAWCVISVREDALAEQLVAELDRAYSHDLQTGLLNRNKYETDLASMSKSEFGSFVCVYIDAVGLHEINNLNGHSAGDAMLKSISDAALKQFNRNFVYRIGGDEFVILAPNSSLKDVRTKIGAMRSDLRAQCYEISVGMARASHPSELSTSLAEAEKAMRAEKEFFYSSGGGNLQKRDLNEKLEEMIIEKEDAERFLKIFLPESTDIFVYNLATDELRTIAIAPDVTERLDAADGSFRTMLEDYRDTMIVPESLPAFDRVLDFKNLRKKLLVNTHFHIVFARRDGKRFNLWILPYSNDPDDFSLTMWVFSEADDSHPLYLPENDEEDDE